MLTKEDHTHKRESKQVALRVDFVVAGGGLAGTCAAIAAARQGLKVVLVQDRPVLGGNASSEVRLWALGATSHMGNNNRWAREGGIIDEILVENLYRNKEGNAIIFDTVLLEKVTNEPNITLLLNTAVYDVYKNGSRHIEHIKAFCSQNSTTYSLYGSFFCDASGDGIVSFLAGAAFRMGAENKEEFGELFAPDKGFGELLGHSMYFYSKRTDHPVKFVPPAYALKDISKIPNYRSFNAHEYGCRLWWIEYGGRIDTVHETEKIKWELWKVIYGVWDYIKNSGEFEDVDNLTLEWVGTIPGKRESRRFEGLYMLKQQDIVNQQHFDDAVSFGGWALDLHPADGIYSELPSCTQWHSKGIYTIPYRSFVSKDVDNLFFAGRIISTSHVAFGSTRVMVTCGHGGPVSAVAAALCLKLNVQPKDLLEKDRMQLLQQSLNEMGQSIPGVALNTDQYISQDMTISASSTLMLEEIPFNGDWMALKESAAQMLPLTQGAVPEITINLRSTQPTALTAQLRISSQLGNYTPDVILETKEINVEKGEQQVVLDFKQELSENQYVFITLLKNENIEVQGSQNRYTGILSVFNGQNKAVSNHGIQDPPEGLGVEKFEFWCPRRRPEGNNIAMEIKPAIKGYTPENIVNGFVRPYLGTNAWAAALNDPEPTVKIDWSTKKTVQQVTLFFDTDYDHPLESSLLGHPESVIPFCVKDYVIMDDKEEVIYKKKNNHQTMNKIKLEKPVETTRLTIRCDHPAPHIPAAIFQVIIA